MMERAYELKLPFAVLLPTKCLQTKKFGQLMHTHGVSVYVLNPEPTFWVNGEKKFVGPTSWYLGNLPHHRPGGVQVIWAPIWSLEDAEDEEEDL